MRIAGIHGRNREVGKGLRAQQRTERRRVHRGRDQEALRAIAADASQQLPFFLGLDAFGGDPQPQLPSKLRRGPQRGRAGLVAGCPVDEGAVDLQFGERRRDQAVERAVALAEIVLRQAEALQPQPAGAHMIIARRHRHVVFQQFEGDVLGGQALPDDPLQQFIRQSRPVQQPHRQVDRHRNAKAGAAPGATGRETVVDHADQQFVLQAVAAHRRQERARQQQALVAMAPARQRLGPDDGAGRQRLLGLEPGLDGAVAQGRRHLVARRRVARAIGPRRGPPRYPVEPLRRDAGDLFARDGLDEDAEQRQADFTGHQADAVGQRTPTSGDDRQHRRLRQSGQFADELRAVHAGHADVRQHQVVVRVAQAFERGGGALGGVDVADAGLSQQVAQRQALQRMIVQDQRPAGGQRGHVGSFAIPCRVCASTRKGSGLPSTWSMPAASPRCAISALEPDVRPMIGPAWPASRSARASW
ncbi:Uncharacterised protein [Achromobacter sp. 2789STDY5608615]|nr:Uncharacterised protein [Achromobacter sp. 2789STDY5608615]